MTTKPVSKIVNGTDVISTFNERLTALKSSSKSNLIDVELLPDGWKAHSNDVVKIGENATHPDNDINGCVIDPRHFKAGKVNRIIVHANDDEKWEDVTVYLNVSEYNGTEWVWKARSTNCMLRDSNYERAFNFDDLYLDGLHKISLFVDTEPDRHMNSDINGYTCYGVKYADLTESDDESYVNIWWSGHQRSLISCDFVYDEGLVQVGQTSHQWHTAYGGTIDETKHLRHGSIEKIVLHVQEEANGSWSNMEIGTTLYLQATEEQPDGTWQKIGTSINAIDSEYIEGENGYQDLVYLFEGLPINGERRLSLFPVLSPDDYTTMSYNPNKTFHVELGSRESGDIGSIYQYYGGQPAILTTDFYFKPLLENDYEVEYEVFNEKLLSTKEIDFGVPVPTTYQNAKNVSKYKLLVEGVYSGSCLLTAYMKGHDGDNIGPEETLNMSLKVLGKKKSEEDSYKLFGYRIKEDEPDPSTRVEYLTDCENGTFEPCYMDFSSDTFNWGSWQDAFFIPKPCALRFDGTVDYYLDPNDFALKDDGTPSDVSDMNYGGNFMMEFPRIFVKFYKEDGYLYVYVSDKQIDSDFECYSCKLANGTYSEHFYLPMFEGTADSNNRLRSVGTNDKPTGRTTGDQETEYSKANGKGWNTTTWSDELLMWLLFPLLFKSTDSQSVLGKGALAANDLTCNNDGAISRGLMYGTSDYSASGVTYLGLHNWYKHRNRRCSGLLNKSMRIFVKMTDSTIDGSTTIGYNRTGDGYIDTGYNVSYTQGGYIHNMSVVDNYGIMPETVDGTDSTYYTDGMYASSATVNQLYLGGDANNGNNGGLYYFDVNHVPSHTYWCYGASISYHPYLKRILNLSAQYATSIGYEGDEFTSFMTDDEYAQYSQDVEELIFPNLQRYKVSGDRKQYNVTKVYFPELTEIIGIGGGVPAFNLSGELTSEKVPNLTKLGNDAFTHSTGLTRVDLPNLQEIGMGSFDTCKNITSINLPSITQILYRSFANCTGLEELNCQSVTYIGHSGLGYVTSLKKADFPLLERADAYAFLGCHSVTDFNFQFLESVGEYCFDECTSATTFDLPVLRTAGHDCFINCSSAETFNLPALTTADNKCFYHLTTATDFNLQSLETAGDECFNNCSSVEQFDLPALTTAGNHCFDTCSAATSFNTPVLETVGDYCFRGCNNVSEFHMPQLETVSNYCFARCSSATVIDIPNLRTAGNYAFRNDSACESFDYPLLTSIGQNGFEGCSSVEEFHFPALTTCGVGAFDGCTGARILSLPALQTMAGIGIATMTNLQEIYFPSATNIQAVPSDTQTINKIQLTSLPSFTDRNANIAIKISSLACETAIDLALLKNWNANLTFNTEYNKTLYISRLEQMDGQTDELPANVTIWTNFFDANDGAILEEHKGSATIVYGKTHEEFIDEFFNGRYDGPVVPETIAPERLAAYNETSIGYDGDTYTSFLTDEEYEKYGNSITELVFPNLQRYRDIEDKEYNVERVYFPELTTIGRSNGLNKVFNIDGGELTSDNLPKLETFDGVDLFVETKFTNVNLPNVKSITNGCFSGCGARTFTFENATWAGYITFMNCSQAEEFNMPKLETIGMGCFQGTPRVREMSFPLATDINSAAFYGCGASILSLPSVVTLRGVGTAYMYNLEELYIPSATTAAEGLDNNRLIKKIQLTSVNTLSDIQESFIKVPCSCACETAIDLAGLKTWDVDIDFNPDYPKYIYISNLEHFNAQVLNGTHVTVWASNQINVNDWNGTFNIERLETGHTHQEFIDTFFGGRYEGPEIIETETPEPEPSDATVYAYRINESEPDPSTRVEYVDGYANSSFTPCKMNFDTDEFEWGSWQDAFFIPKPCALTFDGQVDYYLNPNDFTQKENGDPSDVTDINYGGNFMMEFPAIFVKFNKDEEGYLNVWIANKKIDEDYECWSCKKSDGSYAEHFYLPMFEGTLDDQNRLRSVATNSKPTDTTTAAQELQYATANGSGWYTTLWADELLMWLLFPLLFKSSNSQGALGFGGETGTYSVLVNNNTLLDKGLMYGKQSSSSYGLVYMGLHNWWGNRDRRCNGFMLVDRAVYVKMTPSTIDGSSVETFSHSPDDYINTGYTMNGSGEYITQMMTMGKYGIFPLDSTTGGGENRYYCDTYLYAKTGTSSLFLGAWTGYFRERVGLFCVTLIEDTSQNEYYGASISYHPNGLENS